MGEPASNIRNIPYKDIYEDLEKRVEKLEKEKGSSGGGGGNMEARIAKLESDVENIKSNTSEMNTEIRNMRSRNDKDFRILVSMQFTTILGIVGLLVKIFS